MGNRELAELVKASGDQLLAGDQRDLWGGAAILNGSPFGGKESP